MATSRIGVDIAAAAKAQLAPTGTLVAAVNMSNKLLVRGLDADGVPFGVAPDVARELASMLGCSLELRPYEHPDLLVADSRNRAFNIGFVGADPARAEFLAFSQPWVEIEVGVMVRPSADCASLEEVDRPGFVVAAKRGSAYHLWLERNLRCASIMTAETQDSTFLLFKETESIGAIAALRSSLEKFSRDESFQILEGHLTTVQQAVGCLKMDADGGTGVGFVNQALAKIRDSGRLEELIEAHGMDGYLRVATTAGR